MLMSVRRRILAAARDLAEKGILPPGSAADADAYGRMRAGFFLAPESRQWPDVYHQQVKSLGKPRAAAE